MEERVDELIIKIEEIDLRIVAICSKRGIANPDEAQVLKYRRCFLLDKLTRLITGEEEEESLWTVSGAVVKPRKRF